MLTARLCNKKNSRPLFVDFKTQDFSPLIERVIGDVSCLCISMNEGWKKLKWNYYSFFRNLPAYAKDGVRPGAPKCVRDCPGFQYDWKPCSFEVRKLKANMYFNDTISKLYYILNLELVPKP